MIVWRFNSVANWAKKLKRNVQQLLEGGDWGNKEKYRKMEKSGELIKIAPVKKLPFKEYKPKEKVVNNSATKGVETVRTKNVTDQLKKAGLSDEQIKKLRGK
jgi:hypothetical protein